MGLKWWILRAGAVALIALGLALVARGDDQAVDPPELTPVSFAGAPPAPLLPSSQLPPVAAELSPPSKAGPPAQAEVAPPSSVATVHISVPPAAPAPPLEHLVRIVVTSAPAAATAPPVAAEVAPSAPVLAELRHPGPVRNAIGSFGEWLATAKRDRLVMPAKTTAPVVVHVVQTATATGATPPAQAEVRASPQSPFGSFGSIFRR